MTRINIVDPIELTDQHLVAEYREIFMVGSSLERSLKSPNWDENTIPKSYTLNKGHVKFFYNKGQYLHDRYQQLINEMEKRGMKPDRNRIFKIEQWPAMLYQNWEPTEAEKNIARERINLRISQKPDWYRYYGERYLYGHYIGIGYRAYRCGIKEPEDSPEYLMAQLAEVKTTVMNDPVDDFNQGWLKALYEERKKNE